MKTFDLIKSYFIITIGLFLTAMGWTLFLIPSKIIGGGLTGLATIVYYATGLSVGVFSFIANIFLLIVALKILGKGFGVKTVYAVVVLSSFLYLGQSLAIEKFIEDDFMATIIGAALAGVGIGLSFNQNGSTGGTDIIAMIIRKYISISPGRLLMFIDFLIISASYFVFRSPEKIVYAFVAMAVLSYTIDLLVLGAQQSVQIFIMSENYERTADILAKEIKRGITIIDSVGWYTRKDKKIIMIIMRKYELRYALKKIKTVDPNAFFTISNVSGVYGSGFDKLL